MDSVLCGVLVRLRGLDFSVESLGVMVGAWPGFITAGMAANARVGKAKRTGN
jgi:hypothetical protein